MGNGQERAETEAYTLRRVALEGHESQLAGVEYSSMSSALLSSLQMK